MVSTRTADVTLHEGWCVVATIRENAEQSLDDADANIAASVEMCRSARLPLLVDISRARPLEAEVRHHYTGKKLLESFEALALQVEASPLGQVMGNIYLRIARPGIPTRLFAHRDEAFAWLHTFRR